MTTANLAQEQPVGALEAIAHLTGPMPTSVSVSHTGRIFINSPVGRRCAIHGSRVARW